jgi:acyl dehydratase
MLNVENPSELARYVGQKLGTSEWLTVDQAMIDAFANTTGDTNWIHIDVERARREMPDGRTIAHGFLTLSLIPQMSKTVYHIQQRGKGFNYGTNRVRFTAPVPVNSRIRLSQTLKEALPTNAGIRFTFECVVEVEGSERPAVIAETIVLIN